MKKLREWTDNPRIPIHKFIEYGSKADPPSLTICSYGGREINVIGQLPIYMSLGERKCRQTVLVQNGASVDLLLGTDTLPCLGFHLLLFESGISADAN